MKIRRYQTGSVLYTPSVYYSQETSEASSGSDTRKMSPFAKELLDVIKTNGIDSDVDEYLSYLGEIMDIQNDPFGENLTLAHYLAASKRAMTVKNNKELYDKAVVNLNDQDAWHDVAYDTYGRIYCWDSEEKDVKMISPSEYTSDSTYKPLTNADLLELRRKGYAWNQEMLQAMTSVQGINDITKDINTIIDQLGTLEQSGPVTKIGKDIMAGISLLNNLSTVELFGLLQGMPDGQATYTTRTTYAQDEKDLKKALTFIRSQLNDSENQALNVRSAVTGFDQNFLILTMLAKNTDHSYKLDPEKQPKGGSTGKTGDENSHLTDEDNYLSRLAAGEYGPMQSISIVGKGASPGSQSKLNTVGWNVGPIIDHDRKTLTSTTLRNIVTYAWGIQTTNTENIYFGKQQLIEPDLDAIVWDNTQKLHIVLLPYTITSTGSISPNFDIMEKLDVLNDPYKMKGKTPMEIDQYIKSNFKEPEKVVKDPQTGLYSYKTAQTLPFYTFKAYTSSDVLDVTPSLDWLEHIPKVTGKRLMEQYDRIVKYGKLHVSKSDLPITDYDESKKNNFYAGNVYIPADTSYSGWMVSGINQNFTKDTFTNVAEKQQIKDAAVQSGAGNIITNF